MRIVVVMRTFVSRHVICAEKCSIIKRYYSPFYVLSNRFNPFTKSHFRICVVILGWGYHRWPTQVAIIHYLPRASIRFLSGRILISFQKSKDKIASKHVAMIHLLCIVVEELQRFIIPPSWMTRCCIEDSPAVGDMDVVRSCWHIKFVRHHVLLQLIIASQHSNMSCITRAHAARKSSSRIFCWPFLRFICVLWQSNILGIKSRCTPCDIHV